MRHLRNIIYYGAPLIVAGLGVHRLYRATRLDRSDAETAFVVGLMLLLSAAAFVALRRSRERSALIDAWEQRQADQSRRMRQVEKELAALRQDVHSRLAVTTWLEAMDRADAHQAGSWVQLNKD